MALAKRKSKSNGSSIRKPSPAAHYVVCIRNDDYPASLETRKIYKLIPDANAWKLGFVRVIDESGEDYLYPQGYFVAIKLPRTLEEAIQIAS